MMNTVFSPRITDMMKKTDPFGVIMNPRGSQPSNMTLQAMSSNASASIPEPPRNMSTMPITISLRELVATMRRLHSSFTTNITAVASLLKQPKIFSPVKRLSPTRMTKTAICSLETRCRIMESIFVTSTNMMRITTVPKQPITVRHGVALATFTIGNTMSTEI